MKINIPISLQEEIDWHVKRIIADVKLEAADSLKRVENWRDYVSDESLDISTDVCTAEDDANFYDFGNAKTCKLIHIVQELYPDNTALPSGSFYYPETGYMAWHTNSNEPCKRLYITHSDGESFFKYRDQDGEIVTEYDEVGLSIREFIIPDTSERLWHCVGSNCNRFSFGFRID